LEAWTDDFQAIAACTAIKAMKGVTVIPAKDPWPINQQLGDKSKALAQYFAGIAHGLHYLPLRPYSEYSGAFGHGYSWVAHQWFESQGIQGWVVKGTPKAPSILLQGKTWSKGLPVEIQKLEALLRRSARQLDMMSQAHSWCRTKQQLLGHGVKAGLPWDKVGVLTAEEAQWFESTFSTEAKAYKDMLDSLEPQNVSFDTMKGLPSKNSEISKLLRRPTEMAEGTIRGRFLVLVQGKNKRTQKAEAKLPIEQRIASLDMEQTLGSFHPLFLRKRQFRLSQELLQALERGNLEAKAEAVRQATQFCSVEQDPSLRNLATVWFEQTIGSA
jgi:hypothetical protein